MPPFLQAPSLLVYIIPVCVLAIFITVMVAVPAYRRVADVWAFFLEMGFFLAGVALLTGNLIWFLFS